MKHSSCIFGSLTRISNLPEIDFEIQKIEKDRWRRGDYVALNVTGAGNGYLPLELRNGRMVEVMRGDCFVGALGDRQATLEATGSWQAADPEKPLTVLTAAGLIGRLTSKSAFIPSVIKGDYHGHLLINGKVANMADYVTGSPPKVMDKPVVLLVGTSMSSGKTTIGRVIIRELKQAGLRVVAAKLTGAGRYKDILAFSDAGADKIIDFVDAGLPSTICSPEDYQAALRTMSSQIAHTDADVAVIEIGASPLEPYNGELAIRQIQEHIRFVVLCTSDPHAVIGLMGRFEGFKPDIVSGSISNTEAGRRLVEKWSGVPVLNLLDREMLPELRRRLEEALEPALS